MAADNNYELNACYDMNVKHPAFYKMNNDSARLLKHGYLACVSFIDACLGKLLDELDRLDLSKNTIVVLYGDNGWKLGEHNAWCKQTNYKPDINVPLIISSPQMKNRGFKSYAITELIDIFPTVCDAAKIPLPSYLQGTSLLPLINNSNRKWKSAAFSQMHRIPKVSLDGKRYMGYSMMTENWHYIKWYYWNDGTKNREEWVANELYDMQNDSEENRNIAELPKYSKILSELNFQFNEGWQKAKPKE
jgi:arylsulfatase A-like enzyme